MISLEAAYQRRREASLFNQKLLRENGWDLGWQRDRDRRAPIPGLACWSRQLLVLGLWRPDAKHAVCAGGCFGQVDHQLRGQPRH